MRDGAWLTSHDRLAAARHGEALHPLPPFLGVCCSAAPSLRPDAAVFKEFGDIVEIVILRDRRTGMHQGCCFVKYTTLSSAQAAIQALHNQRSLPPLRNPLQARCAPWSSPVCGR